MLPYDESAPYSKRHEVTGLESGLTDPCRVAAEAFTPLVPPVVTTGLSISVVSSTSSPFVVPPSLVTTTR